MVCTTIRRFAHVALLAGMLLLPVLMGTGHAAAAIPRPCEGTGCNGKDPIAMTCDQDAYIAEGGTFTNTNVLPNGMNVTYGLQLLYSPACGTNWARAYIVGPPNSIFKISPALVDATITTVLEVADVPNASDAYGNMWYAPSQPVRACVYLNGKQGFCTAAG